MLLVLDPCTIGISPEPNGGVVIQVKDLEGPFTGVTILIPVAEEAAGKLREGIGALLHSKVATYGPHDLSNLRSPDDVA